MENRKERKNKDRDDRGRPGSFYNLVVLLRVHGEEVVENDEAHHDATQENGQCVQFRVGKSLRFDLLLQRVREREKPERREEKTGNQCIVQQKIRPYEVSGKVKRSRSFAPPVC